MNFLKVNLLLLTFLLLQSGQEVSGLPKIAFFENGDGAFALAGDSRVADIFYNPEEDPGVVRAVTNLAGDIFKAAGYRPEVKQGKGGPGAVIIATYGVDGEVDGLLSAAGVQKSELEGKREKYVITTVGNPFGHAGRALLVMGSDRRGTIYGIYELSAQIGVSPWYYWADVPVERHENIYIRSGVHTDGEPAVKYRGIFLNDEAPALTGWVNENFGGYNHRFYEKVFELLLRLKGNFMWPAMWDAAFYDDDPLNSQLAHEMGIIMGTSHHEPMARAHKEWKRYGSGAWDYRKNRDVLDGFWREGVQRMKHTEDIVTIGMRGDGDEAMSEESDIKLLERIVADQRRIIEKTTGKPAVETPQVWALYKEVQDYYDKGMRVPDDVTLLLCDDNWGNVRKLPELGAAPRKGGYGMYYHFDYVGGPRSYKWINVSQAQRIWEQMNLTYEYGVRELWVVNVGDLKPMEYPVQFFLDMAWDPARFDENNIFEHTVSFCATQFGSRYAEEAARLINLYTKYNRRVTPELLNYKTYSLDNYDEFRNVRDDYRELAADALKLYYLLPQAYRDAFDQLVLYPVQACSNLYDMYYAVAMNYDLYEKRDPEANYWAGEVRKCFERDSVLSYHYNKVMGGGKWNHMMDQVRIGYTYWQQPEKNIMPLVRLIPEAGRVPAPVFVESDGCVSVEAANFTRAAGNGVAGVTVVPDLGKTGAGVMMKPVAVAPQTDAQTGVYVEYDMELSSSGEFGLTVLLSPTLNFNGNRGLRYAVSFDDGPEQTVNINREYDIRKMEGWQAASVNSTVTKHVISGPGRHTLRFRFIDPGIVLQKIILDMGGLKPSYLGPPQSETIN